jgi:hypothetical protein
MHRKLLRIVACSFVLTSGAALAQTGEDTRPIQKTLDVDRSFRIDLANDCAYNARIQGKIEPTNAPASADAVRAKLEMNADLQCGDQAALLKTVTIAPAAPMTRAELERTIEQRAVLSETGQYACSYTPDFNLSNAGLYLRGVSYRCPTR